MLGELLTVSLAHQALQARTPPLGHAGQQYNAVHAAQRRLRESELAEAGSFWALSNFFIMKDVRPSRPTCFSARIRMSHAGSPYCITIDLAYLSAYFRAPMELWKGLTYAGMASCCFAVTLCLPDSATLPADSIFRLPRVLCRR